MKPESTESREGTATPSLRRSTDRGAGVVHEVRAAGGTGDEGDRDREGGPVHTLTLEEVEEGCHQGAPPAQDKERDLVPGGAGDRA